MSGESGAAKEDVRPGAEVMVLDRALSDFQDRELRYRELLDALPAAIYTTDAAGRLTFYNEACVAFAGRRPVIGADQWCIARRLYRPDGLSLPLEDCPMAVALRERRPVRGEEAVIEREDGTRTPFIAYPTPLYDAAGDLIGGVNMLVDITQRKEVEDRLQLLSHEVNHRANNLLAVVQATLRLTEGDTVAAFKQTLEGRIHALGRAHNLVARSQWRGADLRQLVMAELAQHLRPEPPHAILDGPALALSAGAAQAMAMAVHELAANAARHGALSSPDGVVRVDWRQDPDDGLCFRWTETGGPAVAAPLRRGVGMLMIERAVRQFGGRVSFDWRDEGLVCEIVALDD